MFGCLRRLGCLVVLVALAGVAYYWYTNRDTETSPAVAAGTWIPVTSQSAVRGRSTVESLWAPGKRNVALAPDEAAGYVVVQAAGLFPAEAANVEAMIRRDTIYVRGIVELADLGGARSLGPLASMLSARDTVYIAGTVDVPRDGVGHFRVAGVRVHGFDVPRAILPKLVEQLRREGVKDTVGSEGVPAAGVAFILPPYVGDIRIGGGKVTVYKTVTR